MSLDQLIKKLKSGDKSAFDTLYEKTRKSVYYVALSVLRDKALAEDVMQTTYLRVLKNVDRYVFGTNVSAWIVKIAKNEALNVKKSRQREQSVDESESTPLYGTGTTDDYGLLIDLARKTLSDDEFSILMLVVDGYKRREISAMLDLPISTVSWTYSNSLKKMRVALKGGYDE